MAFIVQKVIDKKLPLDSNGKLDKYCQLSETLCPHLLEKKNTSDHFTRDSQVARACMLSHFSSVWLFVTLRTLAQQAPLSVEFSGQEYWRELPCPPAGDLTDPGIKPVSLMSPKLADVFFAINATWEVPHMAPW